MYSTCYHVSASYVFKQYKIWQECWNVTIIFLLVKPRSQSDQEWNWWEIDSLALAMKSAQGMLQQRSLFNTIDGHYCSVTRLWRLLCRHERSGFIPQPLLLQKSDTPESFCCEVKSFVQFQGFHMMLCGSITVHHPIQLLQGSRDAVRNCLSCLLFPNVPFLPIVKAP